MKCDICIQDKKFCSCCLHNPKYKSFFLEYIPSCPFGYKDCIHDPAYQKKYHNRDVECDIENFIDGECLDYDNENK